MAGETSQGQSLASRRREPVGEEQPPRLGLVPPTIVATGLVVWAFVRTRPPVALTSPRLANVVYLRWAYRHFSYSDVISLYRVHHLANHALPYVHTAIEYPVLTGLFMWIAAWFPGLGSYFVASAIGLGFATIASVYFLYRSSPRRAWAFAVTPLLVVYSLLNWDVFAIALMLGGWHFFRRRSYIAAGILLSLAVSAKFFPVVLLIYLALSLLAEPRDRAATDRTATDRTARTAAYRFLGSSVCTWVGVNTPFAVANLKGWGDFYSFNAKRGGGGGILYEFRIVSGWPIAAVDSFSAVVVLGLFVWLALPVLRGASPEFSASVAFAGFMLVNKTYSPQYMLWILVFAIIADWPVWTFVVLAASGLMDFANAMIVLHLAAARDPAFSWYLRGLFKVNRAIRLGSISVSAIAALWDARLRSRADSSRSERPYRSSPVAPEYL